MKYLRFIGDEFVEALNDLYQREPAGWWRGLLEDPDIFLAFRDDKINAYYRGCSVALISFVAREVCVQTHYKYLIKPLLASPMIKARGGSFVFPPVWREQAGGPFIESLTDLDAIKRAAKPFAGGEKKFVAEVIRNNPNVFDVEIALTRDTDEDEIASGKRDKVADRIDIAALSPNASGLELVFYEAKLFENQELRAGVTTDAQVVEQVTRYEGLLTKYRSEIRESSVRAAANVLALQGFPPKRKAQAEVLSAAGRNFSINTWPILIVGGFDADHKKDGSVWRGHLKNLTDKLGKQRVIAKGKAKSINLDLLPARLEATT